MFDDFEGRGLAVKEYEERTLNAARLYSLLRQECAIEDPWHIIVLATCAFEHLHVKEGWEFALTNRQDIENVGQLFERSNTVEEFREGLMELKEQHARERLAWLEAHDGLEEDAPEEG